METIGSRIRQLRTQKGWSQQRLANEIGTSKTSIIYWERDDHPPKHESLMGLAHVFNVNTDWLATGKGIKEAPPMFEDLTRSENYTLDKAIVWTDGDPLDEDDIEVPYYKEILLAAGSGSDHQVVEVSGNRKLRFGIRSLRNIGVDPDCVACATNHGRSMERLIMDGATLAIDTSKKQIKDDRIFAFDHGGLLRVKYLFKQPKGGLLLRSENREEFKDEILTPEEVANDIRIIGWVFDWSKLQKW
ncbi:XRE family transcriptional regulator [Acinetobacter soli]|uniref:XRE family transcriptional regulator n=1 Tax=Acinetobacter soli TaxID=487316 RepID=UPI00124FF3D5|nr:helix-turn-helix transcriptional regulator [Acinetobacter soli]